MQLLILILKASLQDELVSVLPGHSAAWRFSMASRRRVDVLRRTAWASGSPASVDPPTWLRWMMNDVVNRIVGREVMFDALILLGKRVMRSHTSQLPFPATRPSTLAFSDFGKDIGGPSSKFDAPSDFKSFAN